MSYPGLRSIFFLVAAWCMYSRAPQLLADPRFWAEEGSRYFRYATENGFWATLFFLDPRAGYLDVTRHFSAGLALSSAAWVCALRYNWHRLSFAAHAMLDSNFWQ